MSGFHYRNKGTDFVVTLPSALFFSRHETWKIGILDFYINIPTKIALPKQILTNPIHVCCDVVEPSVFNDTQINLLLSVRLKDCIKAVFEPGHVRYVPLAQERITNLHLYLKDSSATSLSLQDAVTYCTLHITKNST